MAQRYKAEQCRTHWFCVIPTDMTRAGTGKMRLQRQAASFC